jgi:hypothetical protein
MTRIEREDRAAEGTQRTFARIAGLMYLWLIVTDMAGALTISRIIGFGSIVETARRVAASEHLYRVALCSELIECVSVVLLAFALYVTLRPVNQLLAQIALYLKLGESFISGVMMIFGFMTLRLYTSPQSFGALGTGQTQALMDLVGHATSDAYNIQAIFFSIGSVLFFYLFFKSRYIPRILSAFGVFASISVTITCFASLIFPEHAATLQYGWAPIGLAELITGFWLMIFAVKTQVDTDRQSPQPEVISS